MEGEEEWNKEKQKQVDGQSCRLYYFSVIVDRWMPRTPCQSKKYRRFYSWIIVPAIAITHAPLLI